MALCRHNRSIELETRYAKTTCARISIDSGCTPTSVDYDICNENSLPPKSCWNNSQIVVY